MTKAKFEERLYGRGYKELRRREIVQSLTLPPSEREWLIDICEALEAAEGRLNQVRGSRRLAYISDGGWRRYGVARPDPTSSVGFCAIGALSEKRPDLFPPTYSLVDLADDSPPRSNFLDMMILMNDKLGMTFGEIAAVIRLYNDLQSEGEPA